MHACSVLRTDLHPFYFPVPPFLRTVNRLFSVAVLPVPHVVPPSPLPPFPPSPLWWYSAIRNKPFIGANGTVFPYVSGLADKSPLSGRKGYFDEGSVFAGGMTTVREYGTDGWFETLGNTYVH